MLCAARCAAVLSDHLCQRCSSQSEGEEEEDRAVEIKRCELRGAVLCILDDE